MIVGITGTLAAGKGNLVEALKERGFEHHSVRKFLQDRGAIDRPSMADLANELRAKNGPSYIVEQLFEQAQQSGGNSVIESVRNPTEVKALREKGDFYLIAIDAPLYARHRRALARASSTDNVSFAQFQADEEREMDSDDPNKQNIKACIEMADYHFWADYETPGFARAAFSSGKEGFLNLFQEKSKIRRPSFNELFMRQAKEYGKRSTCLRRETGAVIIDANGQNFISQGYNGAPRNVMHCGERGGCYRTINQIPSGQRLEECYAVHAELNAILNAGRKGVPVIGATMFATTYPCKFCANAIVQSGIEKVIYLDSYPTTKSKEILEEAGVKVEKFKEGVTPRAFSKIWG